jgi:hypothetical protein
MKPEEESDDQGSNDDPSWDAPISVMVTPAGLLNTVFATAQSVHTAWRTCVDDGMVLTETTVVSEFGGNHCRFVEMEYADEEGAEETWHDWTVELRLGEVILLAHWRTRVNGSPSDWDWCAREAENAFIHAAALLGRRVRRGLAIEQPVESSRAASTRH